MSDKLDAVAWKRDADLSRKLSAIIDHLERQREALDAIKAMLGPPVIECGELPKPDESLDPLADPYVAGPASTSWL